MTSLVDVVNFNADASCLDSRRWLQALSGGEDSEFCRWLLLYARLGKRTVLGLTGATLADLEAHNPEAIEIIRQQPDVFEAVVRPFSHDVALLRRPEAFTLNLALGRITASEVFERQTDFYLPPEFMLSSEQVALLREEGIGGVFVNSQRLTPQVRRRIPDEPYWVRGIADTRLRCVP